MIERQVRFMGYIDEPFDYIAGADYLNAGGTFPDGTASVPSITFSSDTDTGIFKSGNGYDSFYTQSRIKI